MNAISDLKNRAAAVNIPAIPGASKLGGVTALFSRLPVISKIAPLFSLVVPFLSGTVPTVLVVILAFMNIVVLIGGGGSVDEEMIIWEGPLMPHKLFLLPDFSTAKIISIKKAREIPKEDEPIQKLVIAEKVVAPVNKVKKAIVVTQKYVVQVGSFIYESGTKPLVESLESKGYTPKVHVVQQKTHLNNVQAGPYQQLEMARESEAKLRAVGMDVWIDTSEQGYVISLSKTVMLAPALKEMERFADLTISPLRLIKIEQFEPIHSVYMGPYNSRQKAQEVEERMARISLVIPKVQEWNEN